MIRFPRVAVRLGWALLLGWGWVGPVDAARSTAGTFDAGFFASRYEDAFGHMRTKALGPFYDRALSPAGHDVRAYRPLTSGVVDPVQDRAMRDVLWPLYVGRRIHHESQWRAGVFYGFRHGQSEAARKRTWLIPFYFQGRTTEGKTYRALFPLGGSIHDIIGRDYVEFALFPLYLHTTFKDQKSTSFLWPIYSRTTGDSIHRWRIFPFYGVSHSKDKFDKRFILWPIWNDVRYHYPNSKGSGFMLFPIAGRLVLTDQTNTWILPPFFRFTRGEERSLIHAPWPFFQYSSGDVDKLYLWPIWGRKTFENVDRSFFLWPIFWQSTVDYPESIQTRHMIVPFFSHTKRVSKTREEDGVADVLERRHRVWPIYSYVRRGETSRFRTLELWPLPEYSSVERNLAPLWTLYSRVAHEDRVDSEILWGFYRNLKRGDEARYWSIFPLYESRRDDRIDPPQRSWSILKGLLSREKTGDRARWRFLYFFRSGGDGSTTSDQP